MIDVYYLFITIAAALCVFAILAFKQARLHKHCSILNQCISDMLAQPRAAEAIAEATMEKLIEEGYVDPR